MVKVVFIASLSHSGSTLLDLMLNAHPDVASVGELKQLGRFARLEKPNRRLRCTCGADSLLTCEFWTKVSALTKAATGRTIGELNVEDYKDKAQFDEDNVALFQAIAAVSGKRYVVDSSKQVTRLALLLENPALDVYPIFLIRDPKGQICSSQKAASSLLRLIGNYCPHQPRNLRSGEASSAFVGALRAVRSREQVLGALMQQLGLSFDPRQLDWASQVRHNVGGNGMRRTNSSELKLDDKWRDEFTLLQKLAIDAGTLFSRYPFARSVQPRAVET